MKEYFKEQEPYFIKHFKEELPYEGVGLIINNKYYRCENLSNTPDTDFVIGATQYKKMIAIGDIQAVVHSHNNYPHVSKNDMISQLETLLPYCVVNFKNGVVTRIVWWGDTLETQDLLGRYFIHGVYDCYGAIRDFYKHHGIVIPNFAREFMWWNNNEIMFEPNFNSAGFCEVDRETLLPGDVLLMKIRGDNRNNFANHGAVYVGNGLIYHHLYNRASRLEPLGGWKSCVLQVLRNKGFVDKSVNWGLFNEYT